MSIKLLNFTQIPMKCHNRGHATVEYNGVLMSSLFWDPFFRYLTTRGCLWQQPFQMTRLTGLPPQWAPGPLIQPPPSTALEPWEKLGFCPSKSGSSAKNTRYEIKISFFSKEDAYMIQLPQKGVTTLGKSATTPLPSVLQICKDQSFQMRYYTFFTTSGSVLASCRSSESPKKSLCL